MTEGLAIEIAKNVMRERGIYCEAYLLRFKHLILRFGEKRTVVAHGELYLLLSPVGNVRITSSWGVYDTVELLNEAQYVHSGIMLVENTDIKLPVHVKFLQVIPKTT